MSDAHKYLGQRYPFLNRDVTDEQATERGKIIADLFSLKPVHTELFEFMLNDGSRECGSINDERTRFEFHGERVSYEGLYRIIFDEICRKEQPRRPQEE